ncbi:Rqc2 family fibronectin-binding protein [Parasporobacterium paucivorans]|uniref:Rqc2 homolog RqcH n=1 Tax=Parasporobacterium paucivorans DSM 15970 TaxID=1122934 RepID=A0A1M6FA10_9FIRM|nr:NFACT RNA binding domain-containing protein [Parasporobacterium paucivorans]SHI94574.1 Predicted component of the ribosome quality control (RQC) complex, YloA/Tae2 family, contains fibronectin-binding (FbpA) and DUF814 domains [Parasporobacterium paucivorans DSM 15970]
MALDGITVSALVHELDSTLTGGRITKISQPEKDELLLTIKNNASQYRLLISAGASLPLMYLTDKNKQNPMTAPNFCMLLRKHINNAKITGITQPGLERVINISLEHFDDLGDKRRKTLIVELMGKHSNIIFCNEENRIVDSIKHISSNVSSVREVLPGRDYFIPNTADKINPLEMTAEKFEEISQKPMEAYKALYTSMTGLSPVVAQEICHRASIEPFRTINELMPEEKMRLLGSITSMMKDVKNKIFAPCIFYEKKIPVEFSAIPLSVYEGLPVKQSESISEILETYFSEKDEVTRIRQKTIELRQIIQNTLQKDYKKYDLQLKQLQDTEKRDKFKIYGELITAYGYNLKPGSDKLVTVNYYDDEEIAIPLDPTMSPIENAKRYFDKYGKMKRTNEALAEIIKQTSDEITHLESVSMALDMAQDEGDISEIREELVQSGYIRRRSEKNKRRTESNPLHFISSEGYHIYVGKNNLQNEYITFKLAGGNDWWFHAKGIPGSHVIVKSEGRELPDLVFEEAARLAAYYSKGRSLEKVEVDYSLKKNIRKPGGSKPGFVIYHTNFSMIIEPDITGIRQG